MTPLQEEAWAPTKPRSPSGPRSSTATGIRTPVSAVRGRRPSPLDDGSRNSASLAAHHPTAVTLNGTMSRTPRYMLAAAAWCVLAFAILLALAYYVPPAAWLDAAALHGFNAVGHSDQIASVANVLAHLCDPLPYALASALVIAAAYRTRGPRTAAAITILIAGANVTS